MDLDLQANKENTKKLLRENKCDSCYWIIRDIKDGIDGCIKGVSKDMTCKSYSNNNEVLNTWDKIYQILDQSK